MLGKQLLNREISEYVLNEDLVNIIGDPKYGNTYTSQIVDKNNNIVYDGEFKNIKYKYIYVICFELRRIVLFKNVVVRHGYSQ